MSLFNAVMRVLSLRYEEILSVPYTVDDCQQKTVPDTVESDRQPKHSQ